MASLENKAGEFVIEPDYPRDVAAGALGISAMVLPGISGAYMLLILGRYETILAAISVTKDFVLSFGEKGDGAVILHVIGPTGVGAILSLVLLSNLLKWMLHKYDRLTLGFLLGILLGSVVGIWPFEATSRGSDYLIGTGLAVVGANPADVDAFAAGLFGGDVSARTVMYEYERRVGPWDRMLPLEAARYGGVNA